MSKVKVGDVVKFPYGKQPKHKKDVALAALRASNMVEHMILEQRKSAIEWEQMYAVDIVLRVEDGYVVLRDDYRVKIENVEVVK